MDIRFVYKKIFEDLFANRKGLQLYTMYKRYGLSPSKAIDFINEYSPSGVISIEDETTLILTEKGRDEIQSIISDIFRENEFSAKSYLSTILHTPIDKFEPYIPQNIIPIKSFKIDDILFPGWEKMKL